MVKENVMEFEGVVIESSNGKFRVKVSETYNTLCTLSGKMKLSAVKIVVGDKVKVEVSAYDTKLGRIVYRLK